MSGVAAAGRIGLLSCLAGGLILGVCREPKIEDLRRSVYRRYSRDGNVGRRGRWRLLDRVLVGFGGERQLVNGLGRFKTVRSRRQPTSSYGTPAEGVPTSDLTLASLMESGSDYWMVASSSRGSFTAESGTSGRHRPLTFGAGSAVSSELAVPVSPSSITYHPNQTVSQRLLITSRRKRSMNQGSSCHTAITARHDRVVRCCKSLGDRLSLSDAYS